MTIQQDTHKIKSDGTTWCGLDWFNVLLSHCWKHVTCEDCITEHEVKGSTIKPKQTLAEVIMELPDGDYVIKMN